MKNLLPADIFFCKTPSTLGKLIRWFTRTSVLFFWKKEKCTYANHIAMMATQRNIVEALLKVVLTPYIKWAKANNHFKVYRYKPFTMEQRQRVALEGEKQVGQLYGSLKILLGHAPDGLVGKIIGREVYLFRRFCRLPKFPICPIVPALAYQTENVYLGGFPYYLSPDDQLDYVESHPEDWELAGEK